MGKSVLGKEPLKHVIGKISTTQRFHVDFVTEKRAFLVNLTCSTRDMECSDSY